MVDYEGLNNLLIKSPSNFSSFDILLLSTNHFYMLFRKCADFCLQLNATIVYIKGDTIN